MTGQNGTVGTPSDGKDAGAGGVPARCGPAISAIGADGAPGGWATAWLEAPAGGGAPRTGLALLPDAEALAALRDAGGGTAAVGVDMPIGLPQTVGLRACDRAARARLGPRRSSVFAPPSRPLLAAGSYAEVRALVAVERERRPEAQGLSAQAAGLLPRVREIDTFARARARSDGWLWESHPELCFARLNGGAPLGEPKRTAAGERQRRALVTAAFPDAAQRLDEAPWPRRSVAAHDLLDAYAVLATAERCARGAQEELGDGARDACGLPMRIAV
ncbi:MAG TPA: DUF429 domain-containing protein [Capillimicrobium sp.]